MTSALQGQPSGGKQSLSAMCGFFLPDQLVIPKDSVVFYCSSQKAKALAMHIEN